MEEEELIKKALEISGFKGINPVQEQAIKKGLLKGKNLVVAAPTASGKTLIGEIAMLNTFYKKFGKTVYMVPLVALASEKFQDFREKYEKIGIRVAMSVGDFDSSDPWLKNYDCIVASLDYNQPIIIRRNGLIEVLPIGKFWDYLSEENLTEKRGIWEEINISPFSYEAASFDQKNFKFKFMKISKIIRHRTNGPLYELTLETGRKVKVTPSHSIFVLDNLEVKTKKTSKIKVGDYVLIPKTLPNSEVEHSLNLVKEFIKLKLFKNIYIGDLPAKLFNSKNFKNLRVSSHKKKNWKKRRHLPLKLVEKLNFLNDIPNNSKFTYVGCRHNIPISIEIGPELLRILGYYVAEGSLDPKNHKISFVFSSNEQRYVDDLCLCFIKTFNFKPTLIPRPNVTYVEVNNKIAYLVLDKIFKVTRKAKRKEVPKIVFNVSRELKLQFLKALLRGDGVLNYKELQYITVSEKLASDLLFLLLQLNVVGSISEQKRKEVEIDGRKIRSPKTFTVLVSGQNQIRKIEEIFKDVNPVNVSRECSQSRVEMIPSYQLKFIFKHLWRNIEKSKRKFIFLGKRLSKHRFSKWFSTKEKDLKLKILESFEKGKMKASEVAQRFGKPWSIINYHIKFLVERKLLNRLGKTGHYSYITSERGRKILQAIRQLTRLFESDFGFAKVKKIKKVKSFNNYVFDVSIPGNENFVAGIGGVVCHNSNEKMDSLIRHGADWIKDIALVIADEIHMLTDVSRGPTLEITLTRLREIVPNAQYLALSATIKNVKEVAKWLNAEPVISDWRPVKLYAGVAYPWEIKFLEKEGYTLNPDLPMEASIIENTLALRKQALLFVATRRNAESLAENLSKLIGKKLKKNEKEELEKLANEVENVLEIPTKQCKRVAKCIRGGVSFHHAGLLYRQKKLIEENFRNGLIKVIVATPTLAMGLNLPAFRVVMRDLKRYYPGVGTVFIPILEVHQMLGRCGRPTFDSYGEGIILAKSEEEAEELTEHYIHGEPEEITSKLAVEPVLRMHILALIASEFCKSEKSLLNFFSKTFYAFQYSNIFEIEEKLIEILQLLKNWKFIEGKKDKLVATRIGKRVSQLYIDPLTASIFINSLKVAIKKEIEPFSLLHVISSVPEMRPLLSVRVGESSELEEIIATKEELFLQKIPEVEDLEFEDFMKTVKTALMFEAWINEATEDEILTKFRVTPGELRGRLQIADWLVYSLQELALLLGYKEILKSIRKLRVRLHHGIKEELIPLVKLRDIGRVRARVLWKANLRNLKDLKKISYEALSSIIGPKIAKSIKDQLEGKKEPKKELQVTLRTIGE